MFQKFKNLFTKVVHLTSEAFQKSEIIFDEPPKLDNLESSSINIKEESLPKIKQLKYKK